MSRYIALEGVDGSGKTTLAEAVASRLRKAGHEVVVTREPGGTSLGERIRDLLLDSAPMTPWAEALLFAAQRAQLAREVIVPALERGAWVISDRSYYSSLAYQGAARGLGIDDVRTVNEAGLGGVVPDLVFVLDVPPRQALSRQHRVDRIGGEGLAFQEVVMDCYRRLAGDEPERVRLLSGDVDQMAAEIFQTLGLGA